MSRILLIGLLISSRVVLAQDFFRLTGKISNPQQDYLTFTYYSDWISDPREYTLKMNRDSIFLVEFPLRDIAYCDISFGEHGLHLLKIEPGDQIHLTFDNNDFNGTLQAEGSGASKWTFQFMMRRKYETDRDYEMELGNFRAYTRASFFARTESLMQEQTAMLEERAAEFSPAFYALQKADITGRFKLKELGYLNFNKLPDSTLKLSWNGFSEEIKARSIYLGQLAEGLMENSLSGFRYKNSRTLEFEYLKNLKNTVGQGITERILATKILDYLNLDGLTEEIKLLGNDYMRFSDNDVYKKVIAYHFRKQEVLETGKDAPNFIVENRKGRLVELKDFRGKNLVLGFYDDECVLCKEDIRAMEFVEGFYSRKKDLEFVFINLSPKEAYRNFVKTTKPMGTHLNGYNNPFLKKNYNTEILPNYLIIDKSGKILSNTVDEPRLDDGRSLIQELDRLIFEK
ncbi:TlpA family protein disulfide reductase [Leadbetterella sp. DM7]|uniref:TlpA family protein disulfide reductase n=1 Tax=Leadbetterella sp. DM7 TaxID=3235085 RepID=UPI00349E769E